MSQGKIIKCKFLIALLLYQLLDAFKEINHSLIYFFFPIEIEKHSVKHPELWDLLCVVHLDCCFVACSEKIEGKLENVCKNVFDVFNCFFIEKK